jgi:hypothetical protein
VEAVPKVPPEYLQNKTGVVEALSDLGGRGGGEVLRGGLLGVLI